MACRAHTDQHRPVAIVFVAAAAVVFAFLAGVAVSRHTRATEHPSPSDGHPRAEPATPNTLPGPTTRIAGAPAGFAHTAAGATSAAAAFVTTGQALLDVDPFAAETAVRQMASTTGADRQAHDALADLATLRDTLRSGSGPIVFRQGVLATRTVTYTDVAAMVEVWSVGVLARRGVAPPQAGWRISYLELVWERGDWHLDRETIAPGPAPVLDDSAVPATADQLLDALDGFNAVTVTADRGAAS